MLSRVAAGFRLAAMRLSAPALVAAPLRACTPYGMARAICSSAPTTPGPADAGASSSDGPPSEPERVWILGKTWSKSHGHFVTEAELIKWDNSSMRMRKQWAKSAKRRARKKRRLSRKAAGLYRKG